jgi:hypothetical protein
MAESPGIRVELFSRSPQSSAVACWQGGIFPSANVVRSRRPRILQRYGNRTRSSASRPTIG